MASQASFYRRIVVLEFWAFITIRSSLVQEGASLTRLTLTGAEIEHFLLVLAFKTLVEFVIGEGFI